MLNRLTLSIANAWWASDLGSSVAELFASRYRVLKHGAAWADYDGAFGLFRGNSAVVSVPAQRADELQARLSKLAEHCAPADLVATLQPLASAVVGPAYIGYAISVANAGHPARALGAEDAEAVNALQNACDPIEWEHGGTEGELPRSGVFVQGQLAALAGYEVWGGTIAHLCVVTHPGFRGRGFGRSAVAHLARRALESGLLPQYRTLEANAPSLRIAASLGFHPYATSVAVRFGAPPE